jgi:catechol 2,3-dioxygenase-like lactoylglutathione lyase family enzyme
MQASSEKHICQVAFSALNGPGLREWYANVFGLVKSGKTVFFPPATARVQGIPGAWEKCSWLIDQQDYFQLEFFQFWKPHSRLKPGGWRPCDIGYNMLGIAVTDFDQVLRNVAAFSSLEAPRAFGKAGERRACVADPEGNLVEIYERDPLTLIEDADIRVCRPEVPAVVRSIRVSVPSLEEARATFVDAMGLQVVEGFRLHNARDEAMWGLKGVKASSLVLRSANFLLELVEYSTPEPSPWPQGYSIKDQGFMNIAFGFRDRDDYDRSFARATRGGMRPNGEVVDLGLGKVMYVNDRHGFSVEMLMVGKRFWSILGFKPAEAYVENEIEMNAPASEVWTQLTDHASIGNWSTFTCKVLRSGREDPNGIGCVRELIAPGVRILEEVTAWDEGGRHYAYQLRSGAPFRKHQGDIFVTEDGQGRSRVRWAIRLDCWIPFSGKLIAWLLERVFKRELRKLKSRVEAYGACDRF